MITFESKDANVLINVFLSNYFIDYLEEVVSDESEELSVVTLFRGMDYFFELCSKYKIDFPYSTKLEYMKKNYEDGEEIYHSLEQRYDKEITYYQNKETSFRDSFGKLEF